MKTQAYDEIYDTRAVQSLAQGSMEKKVITERKNGEQLVYVTNTVAPYKRK